MYEQHVRTRIAILINGFLFINIWLLISCDTGIYVIIINTCNTIYIIENKNEQNEGSLLISMTSTVRSTNMVPSLPMVPFAAEIELRHSDVFTRIRMKDHD